MSKKRKYKWKSCDICSRILAVNYDTLNSIFYVAFLFLLSVYSQENGSRNACGPAYSKHTTSLVNGCKSYLHFSVKKLECLILLNESSTNDNGLKTVPMDLKISFCVFLFFLGLI